MSEDKKYSRIIDLGGTPKRFLRIIHYGTTLERLKDHYNVTLEATKEDCTKFIVTKEGVSYKEQKNSIDSYIEEAEEFMQEFWANE